MANNIRRQLTLFVNQKDAEIIEQVRRIFNPQQYELIKSHVTLCREDEIQQLEKVITNLHFLKQPQITIGFGEITRFNDGKGLLLPANTDNEDFQILRKKILLGITNNPRRQEPHITLMHPRNATCSDYIFKQVKENTFPKKLKFKRISLIEQRNMGQWKILKEFTLEEEI